jgi:hypothetical protein
MEIDLDMVDAMFSYCKFLLRYRMPATTERTHRKMSPIPRRYGALSNKKHHERDFISAWLHLTIYFTYINSDSRSVNRFNVRIEAIGEK